MKNIFLLVIVLTINISSTCAAKKFSPKDSPVKGAFGYFFHGVFKDAIPDNNKIDKHGAIIINIEPKSTFRSYEKHKIYITPTSHKISAISAEYIGSGFEHTKSEYYLTRRAIEGKYPKFVEQQIKQPENQYKRISIYYIHGRYIKIHLLNNKIKLLYSDINLCKRAEQESKKLLKPQSSAL